MINLLLRINTVQNDVDNEGECCLGGKKILYALYGLAPLFKGLKYPFDRTPLRFIQKMEAFNMLLAQIFVAFHRQNNVTFQISNALNILICCLVLHLKKSLKASNWNNARKSYIFHLSAKSLTTDKSSVSLNLLLSVIFQSRHEQKQWVNLTQCLSCEQ